MEDTQLYMDFLEGSLDHSVEENFARRFASDENFRSGFRSYISVSDTVSQSIKAFGPAPKETEALYSKLGFVVPSSSAFSGPSLQAGSKFFQNSAFKHILTGLFASILSVTLTYFLLYRPANENYKSNLDIYKANISQAPPETQVKEKVKSGNKLENHSVSGRRAYNSITKQFLNNQHLPSQNLGIDNSIESEYSYQDKVEHPKMQEPSCLQRASTIPVQVNEFKYNRSLSSNTVYNPTDKSIVLTAQNEADKLGLNFELINYVTWNLPKETIMPKEISKFNNIGLALSKPLSDYFTVGLEVRQETFFVRYNELDNLGRVIEFEQQPNFLTPGIFLRFKPFDALLGFNSYLQGTIGGNYYGAIARCCLGLDYGITDNLSFNVQCELSSIFFQHNKQWFNSQKLGLNYGISLCF